MLVQAACVSPGKSTLPFRLVPVTSSTYLTEVETGKIEICLRNLEVVAQTFGLELHQLLQFPAKPR